MSAILVSGSMKVYCTFGVFFESLWVSCEEPVYFYALRNILSFAIGITVDIQLNSKQGSNMIPLFLVAHGVTCLRYIPT